MATLVASIKRQILSPHLQNQDALVLRLRLGFDVDVDDRLADLLANRSFNAVANAMGILNRHLGRHNQMEFDEGYWPG